MYIGEISKPTTDKTELKKKPAIATAEPIDAVKKVADQFDLSDEGKRRQQNERTEKSDNHLDETESRGENATNQQPHIDFKA